MPITPFRSLAASYVVLDAENVDTDQIIPARFLTTTERTGLGPHAFNDWRYRPDGAPNPEFVLNRREAAGANVLVAGRNFGCGSSREHAVWALAGVGFRAIISAAFADIFRGNALTNGLLPVELSADAVERLFAASPAQRTVRIDLEDQTVTLPGGETAGFPIAPFAKHCLLHGFDEMDFITSAVSDIADYEARHRARVNTLAGNA